MVFNLFLISLFLIWRYTYFATTGNRAKGLTAGQAMLVFALGGWILLVSADVVVTDLCGSDVAKGRSRFFIDALINYARAHGYCRGVGIVGVALGGFVAYVSGPLYRRLRLRD
nr:hypothetical protein [uncultured Albidiferax sp.]